MMFNFYLKRPALIITFNEKIKKLIKEIVSPYFIVSERKVPLFKQVVLILKKNNKAKFFIKYSKLPILIPDEENKALRSLVPPRGYLVFNYDKESFGREVLAKKMTYGFKEGADLLITDLNFLNKEVNFKINYEGSSIPFWVKEIQEKKEVYTVLSAIAVAFCLGMNLVEISKAFQERE